MNYFLNEAEIVKIMMHDTSMKACASATQAIVDLAEKRYRCLCNFATKDHRRMNKHKITCKTWLEDGVRQWKAISNG